MRRNSSTPSLMWQISKRRLYISNQPWIFIGRTDAEAEAPILWPPDAKSRLIGKDPHAGEDWGQEEKGVTEDEMVGLHHGLNGHEFEQTLGDSEGQGSLVCCSVWGRRVRHDLVTEQQQQTLPGALPPPHYLRQIPWFNFIFHKNRMSVGKGEGWGPKQHTVILEC